MHRFICLDFFNGFLLPNRTLPGKASTQRGPQKHPYGNWCPGFPASFNTAFAVQNVVVFVDSLFFAFEIKGNHNFTEIRDTMLLLIFYRQENIYVTCFIYHSTLVWLNVLYLFQGEWCSTHARKGNGKKQTQSNGGFLSSSKCEKIR